MSKYQELVETFITKLEAGTRPWARSWIDGTGSRFTRPLRATGEHYQGTNVLALWLESEKRGFSAPTWITYKQATALGGQVKGGSKAAFVFYSGAVRIVKDGVPCRVAPWFKNLTSDGKKMIGTNRIYSAPYGKYISFKREA